MSKILRYIVANAAAAGVVHHIQNASHILIKIHIINLFFFLEKETPTPYMFDIPTVHINREESFDMYDLPKEEPEITEVSHSINSTSTQNNH